MCSYIIWKKIIVKGRLTNNKINENYFLYCTLLSVLVVGERDYSGFGKATTEAYYAIYNRMRCLVINRVKHCVEVD